MIKKKGLPEEDKKTWDDYTKNPTDIYDKEKKNVANNYSSEKYRFKFDLHGYTLDEANQKVKEIMITCVKKHYKEILLITFPTRSLCRL